MSKPLFSLGQVVATPGALAAFEEVGEGPAKYLARHIVGDWGEVCKEDAKENDFSVEHGFRLMSVYILSTGVKIWVLTEADRSATTALLPEEY